MKSLPDDWRYESKQAEGGHVEFWYSPCFRLAIRKGAGAYPWQVMKWSGKRWQRVSQHRKGERAAAKALGLFDALRELDRIARLVREIDDE